MARKILRRRQVEEITGRKKSALYADIRAGRFPQPVRIGSDSPNGAVGWYADEVEAWLESRQRTSVGEAA